MKSRKLARKITTKFHKLNTLLSSTETSQEELERVGKEMEEMGGRARYQEASQLSTKHFSTSKWVIGRIQSLGLLRGVEIGSKEGDDGQSDDIRPTNLLEIGAINTDLLSLNSQKSANVNVRAIDLRSSVEGVETMDYMQFPEDQHFDVIVNSMVINSVPSALLRGQMLLKMFRQLNLGGVLFLMLPLLCLNSSKYLTKEGFVRMLLDVGFEEVLRKETPKIFFIVLRRPQSAPSSLPPMSKATGKKKKTPNLVVVNKGKKFRGDFGVIF